MKFHLDFQKNYQQKQSSCYLLNACLGLHSNFKKQRK